MTESKPTYLERREASKNARRRAILDAARRSFLEKGFDGTSMTMIADAIGGSKATLWKYFASKTDLFSAVMDDTIAGYHDRLMQLPLADGDIRGNLEQLCRTHIQAVIAPETLRMHRLLLAEAERFPEIGQIFYQTAPLATQQLFAAYIAGQMERGRLREGDALQAARQLVSLCIGGTHQRILWLKDGLSDVEIEHEIKQSVDLFLRAYSPE